MNKKILSACIVALLTLGTFSITQTSYAGESTIRTRCDFYDHGQCYDHWIPTRDSCYRIIDRGGTPWQIAVCAAKFGIGSRG